MDLVSYEGLRQIKEAHPGVKYETWSSIAIPRYYNPPPDAKWKVVKWMVSETYGITVDF